MDYRLNLGGWRVNIGACSPDVESITGRVVDTFRPVSSETGGDHPGKAEEVFLAIGSPKSLQEPGPPSWLPEDLRGAWGEFQASLNSVLHRIGRGDASSSPGFRWPALEPTDDAWRDRNERGDRRFFAFVMDQPDETGRVELMLYILRLANQWHMEHGGLIIHASAVARQDGGFLFLGKSEAGKTTVAQLSSSIGYSALGDDLNFIVFERKNCYEIAAGPTLSGRTATYSLHRPRLRGIFNLIQDTRDFLAPLTPMVVSRLLFEGMGQVPSYTDLSDPNISDAFRNCCTIARVIPGYELHFRKSPDFWNVIHTEFPG